MFLNKSLLICLIAPIALLGCGTGSPSGAYCLTCSVDIVSLTSDGGIVGTDSFSDTDRERARQLANSNCQLRGFAVASMGDRDASRNWRGYYPFRCINQQQPVSGSYSGEIYTPLISSQRNIEQTKPASNELMGDAKNKCSDLGFKTGTEQFGKCVLQLSK